MLSIIEIGMYVCIIVSKYICIYGIVVLDTAVIKGNLWEGLYTRSCMYIDAKNVL